MSFSSSQNSSAYKVMTLEFKSVSLDENSSNALSRKCHYGSCEIFKICIFLLVLYHFPCPLSHQTYRYQRSVDGTYSY